MQRASSALLHVLAQCLLTDLGRSDAGCRVIHVSVTGAALGDDTARWYYVLGYSVGVLRISLCDEALIMRIATVVFAIDASLS